MIALIASIKAVIEIIQLLGTVGIAVAGVVKVAVPVVRDLLTVSKAKALDAEDKIRLAKMIEAIGFAEELAKTAEKAGEDLGLKGDGKLKVAVDYYLKRVPEKDRAMVEDFAKSTLAKVRGVGATGQTVIE